MTTTYTNTDSDTATARTAKRARCAACNAVFSPRNDAQIYCCSVCRRLGARLGGLRDLADEILEHTASTNRARALYRLRRMLVAAVSGVELPKASEKADRFADGSLRRRRWCACCGADLGETSGRGRPSVACKAASGRRCARFRNRCLEVAKLADQIVAGAENAERARRAMLQTVAEINSEMGLC